MTAKPATRMLAVSRATLVDGRIIDDDQYADGLWLMDDHIQGTDGERTVVYPLKLFRLVELSEENDAEEA